jgi:hypothetical protein
VFADIVASEEAGEEDGGEEGVEGNDIGCTHIILFFYFNSDSDARVRESSMFLG